LRQVKIKRSDDVGVNVKLTPVSTVDPCVPDITQLLWFSDQTGAYSEALEVALLFNDGSANPALAVAQLLGENCDQEITWSAIWENSGGGDDAEPGVYAVDNDAVLIVYQLAGTGPGVLSVSATVGGALYGPIDLMIEMGCGIGDYYGTCILQWLRFDQYYEEPPPGVDSIAFWEPVTIDYPNQDVPLVKRSDINNQTSQPVLVKLNSTTSYNIVGQFEDDAGGLKEFTYYIAQSGEDAIIEVSFTPTKMRFTSIGAAVGQPVNMSVAVT